MCVEAGRSLSLSLSLWIWFLSGLLYLRPVSEGRCVRVLSFQRWNAPLGTPHPRAHSNPTCQLPVYIYLYIHSDIGFDLATLNSAHRHTHCIFSQCPIYTKLMQLFRGWCCAVTWRLRVCHLTVCCRINLPRLIARPAPRVSWSSDLFCAVGT